MELLNARLGEWVWNSLMAMGAVLALASARADAHGENTPGPHGGYIRMPGAFHTELVETEGAFRVYLLDLNWQNPTTENSVVELSAKYGKSSKRLPCKKAGDHFSCPKPSTPELPKELIVKATRDGQQGVAMPYEYPLKRVQHHQGLPSSTHPAHRKQGPE